MLCMYIREYVVFCFYKTETDTADKNIDSKQKKFEQEQQASLQKSEVTSQCGIYHDPATKVNRIFSLFVFFESYFNVS